MTMWDMVAEIGITTELGLEPKCTTPRHSTTQTICKVMGNRWKQSGRGRQSDQWETHKGKEEVT